jgi:thiamine pyrophosphate-dependent acetolactate synthase large subunit-like protein
MPNKMVSDYVLERLRAWGVRRIFGYPGDGINGVIGALRRAGDAFEFVQVANEELAGLMACAHAKYTGEIGVCLSTSGPGAIHMLNGLYDAKLDHMPVFAIVGQQGTGGLGGATQQEIDLHSMLKDVASAFVETVASPEQVRHVIDRAVRIARAELTVTAMILPHDVQSEEAVPEPPREHGEQHSEVGYTAPRVIPQQAELERAAEILNYVTWEQRALEGEPKYEKSQNLPDMPYADYARLLGLDVIRIDDPSQVGEAWDRALEANRPFVIDAVVNADVPTLPPALTKELKEHIDKALAEGDPDAAGVREQIAATRLKVTAE